MKSIHRILLGFGILYSFTVAFLISNLYDLSWKGSRSYYIAFFVGLAIIYNSVKSLYRQKGKSY